jgi:hypothetical protein
VEKGAQAWQQATDATLRTNLMDGLNRYLLVDVCATAAALLALIGTVAAISVSPAAQARFSSAHSTTSSLVRVP